VPYQIPKFGFIKTYYCHSYTGNYANIIREVFGKLPINCTIQDKQKKEIAIICLIIYNKNADVPLNSTRG